MTYYFQIKPGLRRDRHYHHFRTSKLAFLLSGLWSVVFALIKLALPTLLLFADLHPKPGSEPAKVGQVRISFIIFIFSMKLFNDVFDIGMEDNWVLDLVNVLVISHFIGFLVLLTVIVKGCFKSEQDHFKDMVKKMEGKKNQ